MIISHCADIHIRALSRHDEYRDTFTRYVASCKENNVDHIFVGGDIFHTKTVGISPEYIDLFTWWVNEMSAIAKVHLILGNHDGNLVNSSRQDAVSPIIDAIANPNITLYKRSGVYQIEPGYNLCVFSLFDTQGYASVTAPPGDVNIACYHGPVLGSTSEVGWAIEDGLTVDFFKDYDFVLLGDIHKFQHLAYRDNKPIMSYPGTLIQQGYAESLEHGYLLWNIKSKTDWDVQFKIIENVKPYVTIDWRGDLKLLLDEAKSYNQGSRFRIRSATHVSQGDVHHISATLRKKMSASEVTYKIDEPFHKSALIAGNQFIERSDLRDVNVLLSLLKEYHVNKSITDEEWQTIIERVRYYLSTVSNDGVTRNIKWTLKNLQFDNLFAYGENNVIDFESLNGIVGIFGSNRIGKSSIVGSIMYSLFNTTDRGPMKNLHVCNVRKPLCFSKAVVGVNGNDYVIERQTVKNENKKGVINATTALNLFKIVDNDAIDMVGIQRSDTEKAIRELIGNSDDFLMTSLSAQGEINQFIQQGSTKRRQILSRFLDLDVFDKMYDLANKDVNSFKSQLKTFGEKDYLALIKSNEGRILEIENSLVEKQQESADLNEKLSDLRHSLSKHSDTTPVTPAQVETHRNKVTLLKRQLEDCNATISESKEQIKALTQKIESIDALCKEHDLSELNSRLTSFTTLETNVIDLKHIYEKELLLMKQQEKTMKTLNDVPCGDKFPMCKFIKDAHVAKTKIDSQRHRVEISLEKLDSSSSALQQMKTENLREKIMKLQKLHEAHAKYRIEVSEKSASLVKLDDTRIQLDDRITEMEQRLQHLEAALENDENGEVVSIRSNIDLVSKQLSIVDNKKLMLASERGKVVSDVEKNRSELVAKNLILDDMKYSELISSAFSKKGVPSLIITSQLPQINAEIQKILTGIVDFTVQLEIDDESDSMDVYIDYGDSKRLIELASGMEKMVSSVAIRVALINVSSLPKTDMFILDEGFGALDDSGVESCNKLLASLKRYFKTVIVITHVDGVKDAADVILEITKNEKDSRIVFS